MAEFVDNSTQSYMDHRGELQGAFVERGEEGLTVSIVLDRDKKLLRISDNAMGMSFEELERALHVGLPPENTGWRSRYGMGMKTAACWFGDRWTVRTKRLGESVEHQVEVDVERIASGDADLRYQSREHRDPLDHYTVIEIYELHHLPRGRTLGKIKEFLRSMYRIDISEGDLTLIWQQDVLTWNPDNNFVRSRDGQVYRKDFEFDIHGKRVRGWVGVLDRGSRANAGFSILHSSRVVKGWPDPWRPATLYGQVQGSNDLVNQRLVGEIYLDDFDVSHTKDDIVWSGDEEERVEEELLNIAREYRDFAARRRKGDDSPGPSDVDVQTAVEELEAELNSAELVDVMTLEEVPPPEVVDATMDTLRDAVDSMDPRFSAVVPSGSGDLKIFGFLSYDHSPNDPYVMSESTVSDRVLVVINMQHPHLQQIRGSEGLLNYFRHCTYDALAEWKARNRAATTDPDTIKLLKDRLLRLFFDIELHEEIESP
jgi:hypothetical protein